MLFCRHGAGNHFASTGWEPNRRRCKRAEGRRERARLALDLKNPQAAGVCPMCPHSRIIENFAPRPMSGSPGSSEWHARESAPVYGRMTVGSKPSHVPKLPPRHQLLALSGHLHVRRADEKARPRSSDCDMRANAPAFGCCRALLGTSALRPGTDWMQQWSRSALLAHVGLCTTRAGVEHRRGRICRHGAHFYEVYETKTRIHCSRRRSNRSFMLHLLRGWHRSGRFRPMTVRGCLK